MRMTFAVCKTCRTSNSWIPAANLTRKRPYPQKTNTGKASTADTFKNWGNPPTHAMAHTKTTTTALTTNPLANLRQDCATEFTSAFLTNGYQVVMLTPFP